MNIFKNIEKPQLLLWGMFAFLIVALPLTLHAIIQPQNQQSNATAATVLSFEPQSSQNAPLMKNPNDTVPLDVMLDPGTNQVSTVTIVVQYDPNKLSIDQATGFQPNVAVFPTTLAGPIYSTGQVAVELSVGSDPTRAIIQKAKAGTFTFKAIDGTGNYPTSVSFTAQSLALSIGVNESATENVIQSTVPAVITISGTVNNPTSAPQLTPFPTTTPGPSTALPTDTMTMLPTDTPINMPQPTDTPIIVPTNVPIPTEPTNGNPQPTIPIPTLTPGTNFQFPDLFKQLLSILFQNRIINMRNVYKKVHKGQKIPPGQLKRLQKEKEPIITFFMQLIQLLQQSQQNKTTTQTAQLTQIAGSSVNSMFNDYQNSANELNSFTQGLQGIVNDQQSQGINMTSAQSQLQDIQTSIKSINTMIRQSQDSLSTMNPANAKTVTYSVQQNMGKIKNEFVKARGNLDRIKVQLK